VIGVLKWDPRRGFSVDRVELNEDIQAGDLFMTSGLGSRFPEGFLLGTVTAVSSPAGLLHQDVRLAPAVPLARLEDVFVVTAVSYDAPGFPVPFVEPVDSTAIADSLARADSLAKATAPARSRQP
jgi:rod shape-determining protein MreC